MGSFLFAVTNHARIKPHAKPTYLLKFFVIETYLLCCVAMCILLFAWGYPAPLSGSSSFDHFCFFFIWDCRLQLFPQHRENRALLFLGLYFTMLENRTKFAILLITFLEFVSTAISAQSFSRITCIGD